MALENSVSIEAGATTVVGNVTQFVAAEGDLLIVDGIAAIIAAAPSTSSLILAKPWPGPAVVESTNWQILDIGPYWRSTVTTNKLVTEVLRKIDGGMPLKPDATGTLADRAQYNDQPEGFLFLRTDADPFLLYVKTGLGPSDWSEGQRLRADPAESTLEAIAAADRAAQWSDKAYNVEVLPGRYSSYHWASVSYNNSVQAGDHATTATNKAGEAATSATTATNQASTATAAAAQATAWANALGLQVLDFSQDSDPSSVNDWSL